MNTKTFLFLYLFTLLAPCKTIKSIDKDDRDLLAYTSLYALMITGSMKIVNYLNERDARRTDEFKIAHIKNRIQKYHNTFGKISTITNQSKLQLFLDSNSNHQELINYLKDAKDYQFLMSERYKKNNSPGMLQIINELSAWSSEIAVMSIILKQNYLIKNRFLGYKIKPLEQRIMLGYTQKLQNSQPHSCANYNDPGPIEQAVIEMKNDIDFLEKNATNITCTELIIKKLRHCSNILETMPQYQNEKSLKLKPYQL
ncbi:MAG: hypothetical protein NTU89_02740 [Candidatus Dependentiae bacterium]|nr:hypothetical protein [Candidatus Dependentiae bacterium]